MECKPVSEDHCEFISKVRESINFVEVKDNFVFEIDDITPEAEPEVSHSIQTHSQKHKNYFQESQEAKDETEVSDIPEEEKSK